MMMLILEGVPTGLRGELSRWLLEPKAGVFVGKVSARVREKLWEKACAKGKAGACLLIHSAKNEQGFLIRSHGDPSRLPRDFEGLTLITTRAVAANGKLEKTPQQVELDLDNPISGKNALGEKPSPDQHRTNIG